MEEKKENLLSFNKEEQIELMNIKNKHQKNLISNVFIGLGSTIFLSIGLPEFISLYKIHSKEMVFYSSIALACSALIGLGIPKYLSFYKEYHKDKEKEIERNHKENFQFIQNNIQLIDEKITYIKEKNEYYHQYFELLNFHMMDKSSHLKVKFDSEKDIKNAKSILNETIHQNNEFIKLLEISKNIKQDNHMNSSSILNYNLTHILQKDDHFKQLDNYLSLLHQKFVEDIMRIERNCSMNSILSKETINILNQFNSSFDHNKQKMKPKI